MDSKVNSTSTGTHNVFGKIIYSKTAQFIVTACILINSIQLGLATTDWWTNYFANIDRIAENIFIWIFAIEIAFKIISDKQKFFYSPWNIFDFIIVAISFVPGNGIFSILRIFRIFRGLRLLNKFKRLRIITESLLLSIPSISWICLLLLLWFYIISVIATNLFKEKFPEWFGSIGRSMYSLFQIMTLESWSMGIVRPVMKEYPYAWMLFVPFIILVTYTVMNLFIGVMVAAISDAQENKISQNENTGDTHELLLRLSEEVAELREIIKKQNR